MTIEKFKNLLTKVWQKDTAHPDWQDKWSISNTTCGQCVPTALLVQEYFGGEIYKHNIENHYYNYINNQFYDLTKEQFNYELDYKNGKPKQPNLNYSNTKYRFDLLRERLENLKEFKELAGEILMEKYLNFALDIAKVAGQIMQKYFISDNQADYKYDNTIVTKADKEINDYLIDRVKVDFPTHSVDGEEKQFGKSNYVWVCDPVDGTAMYARHIPVGVFSLALVIDGVSTIGVVFDPWTNNIYSAIKGKGAYRNNERISVNDITLDNMKSVSNFDMWPEAHYNLYDTIKELGKETYFVSIGSVIRACMCVANGDFNLAIFPGTTKKNCDIAAVKVIVEEAGGKVTDLFGNEQRYDQSINGAIISNKVVHEKVVKIVKNNLRDNKDK